MVTVESPIRNKMHDPVSAKRVKQTSWLMLVRNRGIATNEMRTRQLASRDRPDDVRTRSSRRCSLSSSCIVKQEAGDDGNCGAGGSCRCFPTHKEKPLEKTQFKCLKREIFKTCFY